MFGDKRLETRLVTTSRACWVLSVLFAVAAIFTSAATVIPNAERTGWLILIVEVFASLGFAALGVAGLRVKWLERAPFRLTLWGVAVLATIVVLIASVG
jgi:hypothetical protein